MYRYFSWKLLPHEDHPYGSPLISETTLGIDNVRMNEADSDGFLMFNGVFLPPCHHFRLSSYVLCHTQFSMFYTVDVLYNLQRIKIK